MRGFRFAVHYAVGQWLHDYDRGFVPRGLVGAIVQPLFTDKSGAEIREAVGFFGTTLLLLMSAAMLAVAAWMVGFGRDRFERRVGAAAAVVVFGSPWLVFGAHLTGFFDPLLFVGACVAVVLVAGDRLLAAGTVCALLLLVHEMFALVGLPVVVWAAAQRAPSGRSRARFLVRLLVLPVSAGLLIAVSGRLGSTARADALEQDIRAREAISERWAGTSVYHLRHDVFDNLARQHGMVLERLLDRDTMQSAVGPLVALLALCATLLWRRRRGWRGIASMGLAVLSPWLMHLVAWDRERVTFAAIGNAYLALLAVSLGIGRDDAPGRAVPRGWSMLLSGVTAVAVCTNALLPVPLMNGHVDGEGLLGLGRETVRTDYRCARPLFRNANFEAGDLSGWTLLEGSAPDQPTQGDAAPYLLRAFPEGRFWFRTPSERDRDDGPVVLESTPFVIDGDTIVLLVGGGEDRRHVHVSLRVEGREVYRASGRQRERMATVRWDVAEHRGKQARIRVVDRSSRRWGRISVDGFCYAR